MNGLKEIEKILAKFSMKDGAFLSTWNENTGVYTVSFEGDDLLKELQSEVTKACMNTVDSLVGFLLKEYFGESGSVLPVGFLEEADIKTRDLLRIITQFKAQMEREGKHEGN